MRRIAILILHLILLAMVAGCDAGGSGTQPQSTVVPPAPDVAKIALPHATRGTPYAAQLVATTPPDTGVIAWTLDATSPPLPTGINLGTDGTLSGTPTQSGLFLVRLNAANSAGGVADVSLDFVVYEAIGYVHQPDQFDVPSNNSLATATPMGAISEAAPCVQTSPLSVTSNPGDPNTDPHDYLAFTTSVRGEIRIDVYFSVFIGRLKTALYGEHNGALELIQQGVPAANGDDSVIVLPDAPAGNWVLHVEAQYKNGTWNANGYTFRIGFSDLTIATGLVEYDRQSGALNAALPAALAGGIVTSGSWSLASGALPSGITLSASGELGGSPAQNGLFDMDVAVTLGGRSARRVVQLRVMDSLAGDYWQRMGEHRYFDAGRPNGDGMHHEHYCEAMVVAPHPAYAAQGAIYVLGGRTTGTVGTLFVLHTSHQPDADRNYKLEDIGRPLPTERQYLGAAFLQHSYGGYIYAVAGELYSITAPSSGAFTRVVERMQVADGAGNALAVPGNWQPVAGLADNDTGRVIEGYAEFALVANDAAVDADDRLYLLGGRRRIETSVGSGTYTKDFNTRVHMFEAPDSASAAGSWVIKPDAAPYTPRRHPVAGMIGGRIYMAGGRTSSGATGIVEMYQPDPVGPNPAVAMAGASNFPTLAQPVWYGAGAVHNGALYLMNGWDSSPSPVATRSLQRFVPDAAGTSGTMQALARPDTPSGFHSVVFHDGKLWFATGRDSVTPTPRFALVYTP